jgi:hypothetical protein
MGTLVDRNASQYSILALGDKQLAEVGSNNFVESSSSRRRTIDNNLPFVLYDREGDPNCRLVREACSLLSLTVEIRPQQRPSPKKNTGFFGSQKEKRKSSSSPRIVGVPRLQDPNTGVELEMKQRLDDGDDDDVQPILSYLFTTYGNGKIPWTMQTQLAQQSATWGLASRFWTSFLIASDLPDRPLTLWAYESSPFCKLVTETLGQLGVTYTVIYTPRGSTNRQLLLDRFGRFQVPFLQDPNTGVELWESQAICEYLQRQYGQRTTVRYL